MSNKNIIFFYGRNHPLSQWYISDMILEGIKFTSAEQWMMYSKAKLFNDEEISKKILETNDPSLQRKLGRQIRGFKDQIWLAQRESLIYIGNYNKFCQDKDLYYYILNTGECILAEASPTDLIWGIGLSETDERRFDMNQWKGLNLLGKILMKVRQDLRQ